MAESLVGLAIPAAVSRSVFACVEISRVCPPLKVCIEVLQVGYQAVLQTIGEGLLISLRFRHLIP